MSPPAAIFEIVTVIGDTRRLALISGVLLAADIAGASAAAIALLARHDLAAVGSIGLLAPVALSWLVAALFLLLAEQPLVGALGELRRATGARVDLAAPWQPLGVLPMPASELAWSNVVPLIAAATIQHARAHRALCSAVVTTAVVLLWMGLSLVIAEVT